MLYWRDWKKTGRNTVFISILQLCALREQKLEDDVSLNDEMDRNWLEIVQGTYRFDHLVKEVKDR